MKTYSNASSLWALTIYYYAIFGIFPIQSNAQEIPSDPASQNAAGASGSSSESVNLSNRGIIIICTIVGVVAVIGIVSAVLFVVAKRRQWAMREAVRRSTKRVTQAIRTPLTPKFPKSQRPPNKVHSRSDEIESENQRSCHAKPSRHGAVDLDKVNNSKPGTSTVEINILDGNSTDAHKAEPRTWGSFFSFGRM